MLRKYILMAGLALVALTLSTREASAQLGGYGVNYGDAISPYLNMNLYNLPGVGGLPVYQNFVEPFLNNGGINNPGPALGQGGGFNNSGSALGPGAGTGGRLGSRAGSHSRYFMNYSHYYSGIRR